MNSKQFEKELKRIMGGKTDEWATFTTMMNDMITKGFVSEYYIEGDMDTFIQKYHEVNQLPVDTEIEMSGLIQRKVSQLGVLETLLTSKKINSSPLDIRKVGVLIEEIGQELQNYRG